MSPRATQPDAPAPEELSLDPDAPASDDPAAQVDAVEPEPDEVDPTEAPPEPEAASPNLDDGHADVGPDIRGGEVFVEMRDPRTEAPPQAVPTSLIEHWQARGWELVNPADAPPAPDQTTDTTSEED